MNTENLYFNFSHDSQTLIRISEIKYVRKINTLPAGSCQTIHKLLIKFRDNEELILTYDSAERRDGDLENLIHLLMSQQQDKER